MYRVLLEEKDKERREAMMDAMLQIAEPGEYRCVWAHRVDCKWSTMPRQRCPCDPQCLPVPPAAHA